MLSEKDKSVVAEMCRTGMSLEVLTLSFPQFDASDIETIFYELQSEEDNSDNEIRISCNCS